MEHEQLVIAAQKGDYEAFYTIVSSYGAYMYNIANCYFKNEQETLDAVQETTCRAFIKIKKLKEPKCFKTWITRILINYCIDEQKRKKRTVSIHKQEIISNDELETDILDLLSAINTLKPKYKNAVILKYFQDMTIADIAVIMKCPEGTVKSWLHRALEQLKLYLNKDGDFNV